MEAAPFTPRLVTVTTSGEGTEARDLARVIVAARLAACVQIVPVIESHYWWEGRQESAIEALLLIKSSAEQFDALRDFILARHSYACPEIVAIAPAEISPAYRAWWEKETSR